MDKMISGITEDNVVLWGCSEGDLKGKIEYYNNIQHFLSGYTEDDVTFTEDRFAKVDVEYDENRVDEIKYRSIGAEKYIKEGYIYELTKHNYMKNFKNPIYINFFNNMCLVWNINKLKKPLTFYKKKCRINSEVGKYQGIKDYKWVADLDYDDAIGVMYRNGNNIYRPLNKDERIRCKKWLLKKNELLKN